MLELIQKGKILKPRRCIVYGTNGIGKSTFGAEFPEPIFIQTEDGQAHLDVARFPKAEAFEDVLAQIGSLITGTHEYKTLVLDSLDWLETLIFKVVCNENMKKNGEKPESVEELGYGKGYIYALEYWNRILKGFDMLRDKKGMAIVLIAHAKIEKFDDPSADSYDRFSLKLHKQSNALVREWADEVLFCCYKSYMKASDDGKNKAIGTGERVLKCQERPSYSAKNRLDMPESIPFVKGQAYTEYSKYFKTN